MGFNHFFRKPEPIYVISEDLKQFFFSKIETISLISEKGDTKY
jgi:hypothetical protein